MDSTTFTQIVNLLITNKQNYQNQITDQSIGTTMYMGGKIDAYTEVINILSQYLGQ